MVVLQGLIGSFLHSLDKTPTSESSLQALIDVEESLYDGRFLQRVRRVRRRISGLIDQTPMPERTDLLDQIRRIEQRRIDQSLHDRHGIEVEMQLQHVGQETRLQMQRVLDLGLSIDALLDAIDERARAMIDRIEEAEGEDSLDQYLASLHIECQSYKGVILEPGDGAIVLGDGNSEMREAKEQPEKLSLLLGLLRDNEIYTNDLLMVTGEVRANMVRKLSYICIEIPRLNRTVLVCCEYGNRTFVLPGIYDQAEIFSCTKEELAERFPGTVGICYFEAKKEVWLRELQLALFEENEAGEAVDITNYSERREYILIIKQEKPTPEMWMEIKSKEKRTLKFGEKGLKALARIFGVEGSPAGNKIAMARLGIAIYGEHEVFAPANYEDTKEWSLEKWREEIIKVCPTPEAWMSISSKEKQEFRIEGKGLLAIATIFETIGHPVKQSKAMARLGIAIYGEHEVFAPANYEDTKEWTLEQWREEIMNACPIPEEWMNMGNKGKEKFKVQGKGLKALAVIFNISGHPMMHKRGMAQLGMAIYGEHEAFAPADYEDTREWSLEKWREEIMKIYDTPEAWMNMSAKDKKKFKIQGKGLVGIAKVFGIATRKVTEKIRVELGEQIYGSSPVFDKVLATLEWTADKWREEIMKIYPTPEVWMAMGSRAIGEFGIKGKKFNAIAAIFGVSGKSFNRKRLAQLGQKIYGSNPIFADCMEDDPTKDWTVEQWREEIKKECPTPEEWMNMGAKEKAKFKVQGKGLIALVRIFGVSEKPVSKREMAQLGMAIYGEHEAFNILQSEDTRKWTLERWREEVMKKCPTPEAWMNMEQRKRAQFMIEGKKIYTVASIFGVNGNPVGYKRIHAQLGEQIYGSSPVFDEFMVSDPTEDWSIEKWKESIISVCLTAEGWMNMNREERTTFRVQAKGLTALGTIFGIDKSPIGYRKSMAELGRAIYGDHEVFRQVLDS